MSNRSKAIESLKKRMIDKYYKDLQRSLKVTIAEMTKEGQQLYDKYIKDYYRYKTTSYVRHEETVPGTGTGLNLYRANEIRGYATGNTMGIKISIDPEDMDDYNYQHDTKEDVLEIVLSGHRGVPQYWYRTWEGSYQGKYFSYSGTLIDALENYVDYISEFFRLEMKKRGW